MAPRNVVFDVGNVLIQWDPAFLFTKVIPDAERRVWFFANVCTPAWNLELDRGRPYAEAIGDLVAQHPDWAAEIHAWDLRWQEMVSGEITANVAVLDRLRRHGVPDYAITNYSREKWADSLPRFPFLETFKGTIVSGHERVVKPDPAIYRLLLDRYGLAAADCVFIDDSAANIAAAHTLGFATVHFGPAVDLAAELGKLGLPV
ncbi:MAG: HAD family hydrolase [Hyphomicrobiaceae bacterium]